MIVGRVAVVAVVATGCAVTFAHATEPAANGRIAFQRYLLQDHPLQADIWAANVDGSGELRVARAPRGFIDGEPDWSPDGSRIVFQRGPSVDGPWTIWTIKADGSGAAGRPQFSPDGKRLVFDRQNIGARPKDGHATFVANVDGTRLRRVTPWSLRAGDHPDWSPDGGLILVRSNANGPDFTRQGNLYVVRPNGTGLRQLTHFSSRVQLLQNGSFSPDGDSIVFATTESSTKTRRSDLPDVFTMSLDGTQRTRVTSRVNWDGSPDWGSAR